MKYLILCFAMLVSLSSCKKDEDKQPDLPPETITGANTAGFIVDGKTVVLPKNGYSSVPGGGVLSGLSIRTGPNFSSYDSSEYFTLKITNHKDKKVYSARIRIHEYPYEPKEYYFGKHNGEYGADGPNYPQMEVIISGDGIETEWYSSNSDSGSITFTRVDNVSRIYSGTFKATLYGRFDSNKIMQISQGRFDIKL